MIEKLFADASPSPTSVILDPGAGEGAFIDGLIRWFGARGEALPRIAAVESDPRHVATLRSRFSSCPQVTVSHADFLTADLPHFDFIIGNPPYVSIGGLSVAERELYRQRFITAHGRFDLYILFFERALKLLRPDGRLVFVTPEKFLYVESGRPLRRLLSGFRIEELDFIDEDTFAGLVTYPLITTVAATQYSDSIAVTNREGKRIRVAWRSTDDSWLGLLHTSAGSTGPTLIDVCRRISCGVATGADDVFVRRNSELSDELRRFAYPTLAGREISGSDLPPVSRSLLLPYAEDGTLLPLEELGALREYLEQPGEHQRLLERTCVSRKPWYSFHETPPLADILSPKILCKDIAARPTFVLDVDGVIVPRHSLYYIVPKHNDHLLPLFEYLKSPAATEWLEAYSQRAARGFLRLQSHVLKRLPVPAEFSMDDDQLSMNYETTLRTA